MIWLRIGSERIPLRQGETTVGRSPYCSIVIDSPTASRQHAAFVLHELDLTVADLGSRNGTALNGTLIQETTLVQVGDVITIGARDLVVESSQTTGENVGTTEERVLVTPVPTLSPLEATVDDRKLPPQ
jgi:pSer/pThr/pTyr-binding forkhead associated (FHA) protein